MYYPELVQLQGHMEAEQKFELAKAATFSISLATKYLSDIEASSLVLRAIYMR